MKQQVDIPSWIFEEKLYKQACIRGLIDTDGCVYKKERKEKNGVEYRSVAINFKTASLPLQKSLGKLFSDLNFKTSVSGRTLYLFGKEQILRYADEIGFSNPKHFNRYQKFFQNYGWVKIKTKIV